MTQRGGSGHGHGQDSALSHSILPAASNTNANRNSRDEVAQGESVPLLYDGGLATTPAGGLKGYPALPAGVRVGAPPPRRRPRGEKNDRLKQEVGRWVVYLRIEEVIMGGSMGVAGLWVDGWLDGWRGTFLPPHTTHHNHTPQTTHHTPHTTHLGA